MGEAKIGKSAWEIACVGWWWAAAGEQARCRFGEGFLAAVWFRLPGCSVVGEGGVYWELGLLAAGVGSREVRLGR